MLPRFTMTENHGTRERFKMTANALPLPVYDIMPEDMYLGAADLSSVSFTIHEDLSDVADKLSCFITERGKTSPEFITPTRLQIIPAETISARRIRLNCTLPEASDADPEQPFIWRWFGVLFSRDVK